jgi:hypothetical protein
MTKLSHWEAMMKSMEQRLLHCFVSQDGGFHGEHTALVVDDDEELAALDRER